MPLSEIILILMGLLTIAMLAAGISRSLPIPYTVFLVILGLILGWSARTLESLEPLLQFQLTPELVFFLFLPALIFESSFNLDARRLIRDLVPIMVLAIPALLISSFVIAFGLWLIFDIQFILAMLFGALISATDPVAVIALFKEIGAPQRLTVLVEGESLLNDATAIVIFSIILSLAMGESILNMSGIGYSIIEFFRVFLGGVLVGGVIGLLVSEVLFRLRVGISVYLIMSIVLAYSSFALAEHFLHVSGVMSVVSATVCMVAFGISRIPQSATLFVKETWEVIALVCNSLLFLLVGLSVDVVQLFSGFGYIIVAVLLVLFARACSIYTMVPATIYAFKLPHITMGERHIMWWGGLKGGLAIAIVLSIPADLPGRDLLLNMTLGVVMFSLLINAPTIRPLIHKIGIDRLTDDEQAELKHALANAKQHSFDILNKMHSVGLVSKNTQQLVEKKTQHVFESTGSIVKHQQNKRHLYIDSLRVELDELKRLYDIGLIQHYTYLDIKNSLQRDRESWLIDSEKTETEKESRGSIFFEFERALLRKLREHDWATGLLARYQSIRLSQRIQRDIASVLISQSVLDMLENNRSAFQPEMLEPIQSFYQSRIDRRRTRIQEISTEFPDFYLRFETRLLAKVSLNAVQYYANQAHQHGEIGTKVYANIERRVRNAVSQLPSITKQTFQLTSSYLIGTVPLLNGLPDSILDNLADCAKHITYLAGDVVIDKGDRGDALYIVNSGQVNVYKDDSDDSVAELRAGDFFGEMALLGDQVRTATAKVAIPTTLLRLTRKDVLHLADKEPELKKRLEQVSATRQ